MTDRTDLDLEDDFEEDFTPVDPGEQAMAFLIRGKGRREIARELHVDLATANTLVANEVRRLSGAAGTKREAVALLHASLDHIVDRAYSALDAESPHYDLPALLGVVLGVQRLRAALLAAEKPNPTPPPSTQRSTS